MPLSTCSTPCTYYTSCKKMILSKRSSESACGFSLSSTASFESNANPENVTTLRSDFCTLPAVNRISSRMKDRFLVRDISVNLKKSLNSCPIEVDNYHSSPTCKVGVYRRHIVASAASSDRPLLGSPPNQPLVKINGHAAEYISPIHRIYQRSQGRPTVQAASDASVPVGTNVEFSEQLAVEHTPLVSYLLSERMKVIAMVAFAMALCNADRVVMSVAIVRLAAIFKWSTSFAGIVQSSFLWGYLMSPIVGGALVDHYGGKRVMSCGVALWSLATVLTPWAANHSLGMLLGMRALMGLAEGVAMPCMNNMASRWFPRSERATAVGLSMAGFHLGSVTGLLATPVIMDRFGVSMPFTAFGLVGFVWLLFWSLFISKDPESHPSIKKTELLYIQQGNRGFAKSKIGPTVQSSGKLPPFGLLLKKLPTWAIIVANSMNNWGYFILLSWMPSYFNTVFGVNLKQAAWFSALPWAMMAVLGFVAGTCSDFLIESGQSVTMVRKIMQSIGFLGPAIALFGLSTTQTASVAAVWLTAAVGLSAFSQAGFLVNFQDIGPRHAGVLHGMANTAGTMAAIVSTIGTGYFIQCLGSFQAFLTLTAILYIMSTLFWNSFATGERVFD